MNTNRNNSSNSSKTLYLFRHGETDWNNRRVIQGIADIELNEKGREQAEQLANKVADRGIEHLYTSYLVRAYETGKIIANRLSVVVDRVANLREMSFGDMAGTPIAEADEKLGSGFFTDFSRTPAYDDFTFPNGENKRDARRRFIECVYDILNNTPHSCIAIVAHGIVLKQFFYHHNGCYPTHMTNCSAMKCVWKDNKICDLELEE